MPAGISRIVSQRQENSANFDLSGHTFAEAYKELRDVCPKGDLHIYLTVVEEEEKEKK